MKHEQEIADDDSVSTVCAYQDNAQFGIGRSNFELKCALNKGHKGRHRTGGGTHFGDIAVEDDENWYYVEGVRYCSICRTRRCKRQVGGSLPCPPPASESIPQNITVDTTSAYPYKIGQTMSKLTDERIEHYLKCAAPSNFASVAVPRDELEELIKTYQLFHKVYEVKPDDDTEPLFTLRGQDILAPEIVREWAFRTLMLGSPMEKVDGAREIADAMENWQFANKKRKIAD